MERLIALALAVAAALSALAAGLTVGEPQELRADVIRSELTGEEYSARRLIVSYADTADPKALEAAFAERSLCVTYHMQSSCIYVVSLPENATDSELAALLAELELLPGVLSVQRDYVAYPDGPVGGECRFVKHIGQ